MSKARAGMLHALNYKSTYLGTIFDAPPGFIYLGLTLLVVPSSPFLLSCARLMVMSPLSTSSEGSSICVELRLGRYPTSVRVFPDPAGGKDEEDSSFLPKEPSSGFSIGSPTVLINTEPLKADEELVIQPAEDRKCKTRGGLSRPHVNRKLTHRSLTSRATRAKTSSLKDEVPYLTVYDDDEGLPGVLELKDATTCHLKISAITPPAWKNHLHNHIDVELLDLHDRCYARQVVVENTINRRSRELFQVIEKPIGEFDVMKDMKRARRKSVRSCGLNGVTEWYQSSSYSELDFSFTPLSVDTDEEDSSFLPKEPSSGFSIGSPTVLINTEPLNADEELVIQPAEVTADSRESPKPKLFVVHPVSGAARIKDRKCKTRGGLSRPHVNRKLAHRSSTSRATRAKTSSLKDDVPYLTVSDDDEGLPGVLELKDATTCHLKISAITPPAWKNHLHNHIDVELLDLHDRCYARQVVVENTVNRRSRELFQVIKKPRGEFDVMKDMERAKRKSVRSCGLNNDAGESKVGRLSTLPIDFGVEAGGKDHPPMLAPGNYVQWKSRIKRYIDTKPNHELIHYCLTNPPYKLDWKEKEVPITKGSPITRTERVHETYKNVSQEIRDQLNPEAESVQIILTGIDNDIYSTVDACPNACEMWKEIERLKHGESINVQDLETKLYWEFGKFTSQDGESLESYYSRFYKMMNELIRNQCNVTNHQVNVQFLLQLQPEWQKFVTLVKQSQESKTVLYHKLYDIMKQHQHEVNEIKAKKIACVANPLALVAQQQPVYHPQNHSTHYTQNSSTRSQQATTRNRGKENANSSQPIYDQELSMVAEDDETSKDKEIDKLMALISLSFKKIYKPTNNNLRTSSNTKQVDWRDDTGDDELEDHMYMAQLQE
nr:hypothetical protein [Tanacetum cinerariifolium]